jgi:uncharacterized protein YukE
MLSILESNEPVVPAEKKMNITRLQQVLGVRPLAEGEEPSTAVVNHDEISVSKANGPVSLPWAPSAAPPRPPAAVPPAAAVWERSETGSPELQQFAEQFARNFLGSLSGVFKDVQALLTEDRNRLSAALEELRRNSRDTEALRSEIVSLRQKVESVEEGRQQLANRLRQAEENLSRSAGAAQSYQETRQQIEKRLELQAGAIRTLNDAVGSRDERLNRLLAALQAIDGAAAEAAVPRTLPNDL